MKLGTLSLIGTKINLMTSSLFNSLTDTRVTIVNFTLNFDPVERGQDQKDGEVHRFTTVYRT